MNGPDLPHVFMVFAAVEARSGPETRSFEAFGVTKTPRFSRALSALKAPWPERATGSRHCASGGLWRMSSSPEPSQAPTNRGSKTALGAPLSPRIGPILSSHVVGVQAQLPEFPPSPGPAVGDELELTRPSQCASCWDVCGPAPRSRRVSRPDPPLKRLDTARQQDMSYEHRLVHRLRSSSEAAPDLCVHSIPLAATAKSCRHISGSKAGTVPFEHILQVDPNRCLRLVLRL